jgi:hypothetical protein
MAYNPILEGILTILNTTLVNVQLASGLIPGMMEKRSLSEMMIKIVVDHAPMSQRQKTNNISSTITSNVRSDSTRI